MGSVGILNVGAGDTKLSFDGSNPAEKIRAGRIVKDMIRRGYALLVEVERDGVKSFERALDFREDTCEYIIADFDGEVAGKVDKQEGSNELSAEPEKLQDAAVEEGPKDGPAKRGRRGIGAGSTRAVAVGRSAGG